MHLDSLHSTQHILHSTQHTAQNNQHTSHNTHDNNQVVMVYTAGVALALAAIEASPADAPAALHFGLIGALGFFLYGPQVCE